MTKEGGYLHKRADNWGKMPEVLMHDKTITDGAARLYTHMHWRYGNNCKNFEGQVSMAEAMGVSTQTIGDRIEELVQHDWIVTVERRSKYGRRPNFYHVFEVQADCIQWRLDHRQPKPTPKVDKKGAVKTRKSHAKKGGKPSHKEKPSDTYVQLYQPVHKLGASSIQNQCNQSQVNESGVPDSFAQPPQATVDAGLTLNPAEREILRACNDGVVIAHYHSVEAANHLIELGLIERCKRGVQDVLCLKGKCPSHDACPDDLKVTELNTQLALLLSPSESGIRPRKDETPSPQTPLPTPPALPEVPSGYIAVYGVFAQHLVLRGKLKTLCGLKGTRFDNQWDARKGDYKPCPGCAARLAAIAAKAAARAQKPAKAPKPKKPAIYSDNDLFEAIAAFCFKVTEKADFKAIGGRVAKIRLALADYVIEKLGHEPTPDETAKVVQRVKALPVWYDSACKDCDRPATPDTFMTWYLKYLQSLNGTAQAEGDAQWFDAPNARWLKREKGLLYERDRENQERWNHVER